MRGLWKGETWTTRAQKGRPDSKSSVYRQSSEDFGEEWGIPPEQGLGKRIWVFEGLKQSKKEDRRGTLAMAKGVLGGDDMTMVRTDR